MLVAGDIHLDAQRVVLVVAHVEAVVVEQEPIVAAAVAVEDLVALPVGSSRAAAHRKVDVGHFGAEPLFVRLFDEVGLAIYVQMVDGQLGSFGELDLPEAADQVVPVDIAVTLLHHTVDLVVDGLLLLAFESFSGVNAMVVMALSGKSPNFVTKFHQRSY